MIEYPKYKKVLFCTDFSRNSDCAFDYAFGIAKRDEGMLYILHIIPEVQKYDLERHLTKRQLAKMEAAIEEERQRMFQEKYLDRIKDKTKVTAVTESGREDEKILAFIRREKIDIIVIGIHRKSGLEQIFLGSVAERIVRRSPIPVFVIPCEDT